MGVKEFAARVGTASPKLVRAINTRHNPTQDRLNRPLKPFELRLSTRTHRKEASPNGRLTGGLPENYKASHRRPSLPSVRYNS